MSRGTRASASGRFTENGIWLPQDETIRGNYGGVRDARGSGAMSRAMRQLCWFILGLVALGIGACLVTSRPAPPTHSQSAIVGCEDVAIVRSAVHSDRNPPQAVMSDLEALAPHVRDAGLVRGFKDISVAYRAGDAKGGVRALDVVDARCAAAGLDH